MIVFSVLCLLPPSVLATAAAIRAADDALAGRVHERGNSETQMWQWSGQNDPRRLSDGIVGSWSAADALPGQCVRSFRNSADAEAVGSHMRF